VPLLAKGESTFINSCTKFFLEMPGIQPSLLGQGKQGPSKGNLEFVPSNGKHGRKVKARFFARSLAGSAQFLGGRAAERRTMPNKAGIRLSWLMDGSMRLALVRERAPVAVSARVR